MSLFARMARSVVAKGNLLPFLLALACIALAEPVTTPQATVELQLETARIKGVKHTSVEDSLRAIALADSLRAIAIADSLRQLFVADSLRKIHVADSIQAGRDWSGIVHLDSVRFIPTGDTLQLEAGTQVLCSNPACGFMVGGVLISKGVATSPVLLQGGRGILVKAGGLAMLAGMHILKTSSGVFVKGGDAILYETTLDSVTGAGLRLREGHLSATRSNVLHSTQALWAETGTMQFEDSHVASTPIALRAGDGAIVTLEDSRLQADTLWAVATSAKVELHDVQLDTLVRTGSVLFSSSKHEEAKDTVAPPLAWSLSIGADYGRRASTNAREPSIDVAQVPLTISRTLPGGFAIGVQTGWKLALYDQAVTFNDRDESHAQLSWIHSGLLLAIDGGYGSRQVTWNKSRAKLAVTLMEESFDLAEPFSSPSLSGGGRIGYAGKFLLGTQADMGVAAEWRGTHDGVDYGDMGLAWLHMERKTKSSLTELRTQYVLVKPDLVHGVAQDWHWQWTASLAQRRLRAQRDFGYELALDMREAEFAVGRGECDFLWRHGDLWWGPALSVLAVLDGADFSGATGPGGRLRYDFTPTWSLDALGWARGHWDRNLEFWYGGDLALQLEGAF